MLSANRSPCRFYFSKRGCVFGTKCRFSHSAEGPPLFPVNSESIQHGSVSNGNTEKDVRPISAKQADNILPKPPKCFQFKKSGKCRFGDSCKFAHNQVNEKDNNAPERTEENPDPATLVPREGDQKKETPLPRNSVQETDQVEKNTQQICYYFKRGKCWKGNRCKFLHALATIKGEKTKEKNGHSVESPTTGTLFSKEREELSGCEVKDQPFVSGPAVGQLQNRPNQKTSSLRRDEAKEEDVRNLRDLEINHFKKRYGIFMMKDEENGAFQGHICFQPTDPDWPFDVKSFDLEVQFPQDYPLKMFHVKLPQDQSLPETVRRYLEVSIEEWLMARQYEMEKQGTVQPQYRQFLRWLDRNIERLVTEGLRQLRREMMAMSAGMEFIPASQLKEKYPAASDSRIDELNKGGSPSTLLTPENSSPIVAEPVPADPMTSQSNSNPDLEAERRGTQITIKGLRLWEGAATLLCEKLCLVIQCLRCKNRVDLTVSGLSVSSVVCPKCHSEQKMSFRPSLAHQFSSIIGYLDLDQCVAFDIILQKTTFTIGCLNCGHGTAVTNLPPGPRDVSCHSCHQKMRLATDGALLTVQAPSSVLEGNKNVHEVAVAKASKAARNPAIRPGKPLPDNGACRHYKKSFRWLRFPCCGLAYPCDVCHDEMEDHEMKFANRMICGFCCKEQPYSSDKPCLACAHMMVKGHSSHWEGGRGCRDKIKMGRNDTQKYSSINKTQSRHAQKLKDGGKKSKQKSD